MKTLHLVCNAHLDPVWLWEWEEGAAEAISTFRVAADLCEEFPNFIFNHNEVILYKWVEEYEPALFARIQQLVKQGKWHIMGGWYLQPDCNMPSGESFVRQILAGRRYFSEKFGVAPTTATTFHPFGHTRGLVQIMCKSGYDSYVFCRPAQDDCPLPDNDFTWVGFDGSEVAARRVLGGYNSPLGQADVKVKGWMEEHPDKQIGILLWGVGNHGGGPSHLDLEKLRALIADTTEFQIIHSTPEAYFADLKASGIDTPRQENDLNRWAVGCYTSQVRIKQKHRLLENELYRLEKMLSSAAIQKLLPYPQAELKPAAEDLLMAQFHDILPGSSIAPVEETSLRLMDHGLEILSRLKARAFFALASGQPKAADGEIPILIYNPHPFPVRGTFECEFQLADQNWNDEFTVTHVFQNGRKLPAQNEKELSNLTLDWRKHVVFAAELAPSQMNRFDCRMETLPAKPSPVLKAENGAITFRTDTLTIVINASTGLMDKYQIKGVDYLKPNAFLPLVIADNEDPWGMTVQSFREVIGQFALMSPEKATAFSGAHGEILDAVRVIEDGDARSVIEALFSYGDSFIVLTYILPKQGTEIGLHLRVFWNEKSKMLKLSIPTHLADAHYLGQVAYGVQELPADGIEAVAQKWTAIVSEQSHQAVTCINDGVYGSDFADGELRLSLLRSAAYSGHPLYDRPITPQDRFIDRIDQGERQFRFWLNAGDSGERLAHIDREALAHNETPYALSFFPSGAGRLPPPLVTLSDNAVQLAAFKKAEASDAFILRLFEPTGQPRTTTLTLPALGLTQDIALGAFEIKTLRLDTTAKTLTDVGLMEDLAV